MPFSVKFEDPAKGTLLKREWAKTDTPPATFQGAVFEPDSGGQLIGSPSGSFVDATPAVDGRLIVDLATPSNSGDTEDYSVTVRVVGGDATTLDIQLHWN